MKALSFIDFLRRWARCNSRGLTLIELVMALGAGAIVVVAASYGIAQLFNTNTRNANYMSALRNAQNAGYWVTRDSEMAYRGQLPDASPGVAIAATSTGFPLVLRKMDSDNLSAPPVSVTYRLVNGVLWRDFDGATTLVAEHIYSDSLHPSDSANTRVSYDSLEGKLTFTVTSRVRVRGISGTETRVYEVSPRPGLSGS